MSEGLKLRWRFQITAGRMLCVAIWMVAWLGALAFVANPVVASPVLYFLAICFVLLIPFVAIGTLFGDPIAALFVGIALISTFGFLWVVISMK
jgi:hypothetical protein